MSWAAVAGAAVGVVGSKLGNKSGNVTSQQTNEPWWGQQNYLTKGYRDAQSLFNTGSPAMAGGVPDLSSPVTAEAKNMALGTLRGDYLGSNPFTTGAVKDAMDMSRSQINSQFAGNNYGSTAHQEWLGRGLMNAALPYMNQNYENERGRQFAALSQTPALAGLDYQQAFTPWDWLGRYQGIVGGQTGGGSSTSQSPYFTNPVNSAVGGALLGNQLYNSYQNNQAPSVDTSWLGNNMGYGY